MEGRPVAETGEGNAFKRETAIVDGCREKTRVAPLWLSAEQRAGDDEPTYGVRWRRAGVLD